MKAECGKTARSVSVADGGEPSTQREDQLTMETKLEQTAVKAVNQLPKSEVREIRTPRSVGTAGGRPPPVEPVRHRGAKEAGTDMFEPKATAPHLDSTATSHQTFENTSFSGGFLLDVFWLKK
jgi:hypothetical protein